MKEAILKILKDRYFTSSENNWEELAKRVSQINPAAFELIRDMKFLPSSPTLINACNPKGTGGLSSCFPLAIGDSMDEIAQAVHDCMQITKAAGGVGYTFSKLRSSKEIINGLDGAKSSGPLAFERIFNSVLNEIQQGGRRRGAGMAAYDIDHPDILDVLESKKDPYNNSYMRFNHSIRVDDEFYLHLENEPNAVHLVKYKDGSYHPLEDKDGKKVTVGELWNKIMYYAWLSAEPGVLNVDIAAERNPITTDKDKVGFNPCCVTGDCKILTSDGYRAIFELEALNRLGIKLPKIASYNLDTKDWDWEEVDKCWIASESAEIVQVDLYYQYKEGNEEYQSIRCTPEHRFLSDCRDWIEAEKLVAGQDVLTEPGNKYAAEVKKVTKLKDKAVVFDLETPRNHNFVCNGVVIHNSEFTHVENSSCNLGSMNLKKYVLVAHKDTEFYKVGQSYFDWKNFAADIKIAVEYLDKVLDHNNFPTETIKKTTLDVRPVGLGIMGLHSAMSSLGISYGSSLGTEFAKNVMQVLCYYSLAASSDLALRLGTYPAYDKNQYFHANDRFLGFGSDPWLGMPTVLPKDDGALRRHIEQYGVRNSVTTSIAPTGTISYICDVSSGIEPYPFLIYSRKIEEKSPDGNPVYRTENIITKDLEEVLDRIKDETAKNMIIDHIVSHGGSLKGFDSIPGEAIKELVEIFQTAGDLSIKQHLDILEQASYYCQTSVSKTINLLNSVKVEDVSDVYKEAHRRGIIGVTIYRDGCRDGVLQAKTSSKDCNCTDAMVISDDKRPEFINAEIKFCVIRGVNYYVAISKRDGHLWELFTGINAHTEEDREGEIYIPKHTGPGKIQRIKSGDYDYIETTTGTRYKLKNRHADSGCELVTRLISKDFQRGVDLEYILTQIEKTKAYSQDFVKAIYKVLKHYVKDGVKTGQICSCGAEMIRISGCVTCPSCGSSKCG